MPAELIDGKAIAADIRAEVARDTAELASRGVIPGLTVVLVGDDKASATYVGAKEKASVAAGMSGTTLRLPSTTTQAELLAVVERLNEDSAVHGILVQMPLPPQVDSHRVLLAIRPDKDVDGFHPVNVGNLVANIPSPRPCTPSGIIEMLKRYRIPMTGRRAVVVGRSDIVGKPMALLLLHESATVTVCHSRTADLAGECRRADILVAAMGRPAFVTADFIQPGATVIDVGINRLDDAQKVSIFGDAPARTVIGDVHPTQVEKVAGAYTPVPGGVGPLTIAMLMVNTIRAAELHCR